MVQKWRLWILSAAAALGPPAAHAFGTFRIGSPTPSRGISRTVWRISNTDTTVPRPRDSKNYGQVNWQARFRVHSRFAATLAQCSALSSGDSSLAPVCAEESFFVRHAHFFGANNPYKSLKTTLKAEIDPEAWESLRSAVSRPFPRPASSRIAVKAINHLGDEVMKVFRV